ncbi:MAG: hypothetical protein KatS3mg031_2541 [Chitinophagales bacterium]|nr:MAG: hypothetical protein KatS3mg031_2541 [Chitinophagales bacterium]
MPKRFFTLIILFYAAMVQAQVTWSEHIAPILYANCTPCHHPGGIAPFSLLTYADAYAERFSIQAAVLSRIMPPWPADPNYRQFAHERVLTAAEKDAIAQWVSNGAPQGNLSLAPAQPQYSNAPEITNPDMVLTIPAYTVSANNRDVYRCFPIYTNFPTAKYITAVEVIPGNPGIVHHVLVFTDTASVFPQLDANDPGPGYTNLLTGSYTSKIVMGYAPGSQAYFAPVGTGFLLPAGATVIIQVHYPEHADGQTDQTSVRFKFSSAPVREIQVWPFLNNYTSLTNGPFVIPANTIKTFHEQFTLPQDISVLSVWPHMHLIGKTIKSWGNKPVTNDTIRWVYVPDWDFHWQLNYILPNVIKAPTGTVLRATATYDNTVNNPNNPSNPPQNVTAGEATTDEMMFVFFSYLAYQNGDENIIVDKRIFPKGATTFCQGQSVKLTTISGTGYTYQWYKDGIAISGATTSAYLATQSGSYTVSITLGSNSALSDPVPVTVNPAPSATITLNGQAMLCTGDSVVLSASQGAGYSYQWYKDGLPVSGATSASFTADTAGSYTVEIYNGCYATSAPVTLSSSTSFASIQASASTTLCAGDSVTLTASPGDAYQWSNGITSQSITAHHSGSYTVTVTVNGCTTEATENVIVHPLPDASVTASGDTVFCAGGALVLSAPAGVGYTYQWSNGATTQDITVAGSGSFSVTVTQSTSGCSNVSEPLTVLVIPIPEAGFTHSGNKDTVYFFNTSRHALSYSWDFGDGTTSIQSDPMHIYSTPGSYIVTLIAFNSCGADTFTNTITLLCNTSGLTLTVDGQTSFCAGDSAVIRAPVIAGYTYQWLKNSLPLPNATGPELMVRDAGSYELLHTDSSGCIGKSDAVDVIVHPAPASPVITVAGNTLQSTPAAAYRWYFNGLEIDSASGPQLEATVSGCYQVRIEDNNGCRAISDTVCVTLTLREEVGQGTTVSFPNPTHGLIYLQAPLPFYPLVVSCRDLAGKLLFEKRMHSPEDYFDMQMLEDGLYVLFVKSIPRSEYHMVKMVKHTP